MQALLLPIDLRHLRKSMTIESRTPALSSRMTISALSLEDYLLKKVTPFGSEMGIVWSKGT